jgi:DNA-binding XRE family transcriptional regulator
MLSWRKLKTGMLFNDLAWLWYEIRADINNLIRHVCADVVMVWHERQARRDFLKGLLPMNLRNLQPVMRLPEPAERIRLRELYGVTQSQLARSLTVSRRTVYAWEHGTIEPTGDNRSNYAAVLSAWAATERQVIDDAKRNRE